MSCSAQLMKVAIAGAAGAVGTVVLRKLRETPNLHVCVLRNKNSQSTYPPDTEVVDVDYDSIEDLAAVLKDQIAVVSTVGASGVAGKAQWNLVEAAVLAGVKRFIPSDFGADIDNILARRLPLFVPKAAIHDHLIRLSKTTDLTHTFIYTGSFLDWGFSNNMCFDALSDNPLIVEGGDNLFSGILLRTAGQAVASVLANMDETRNRSLYVHDFVTTQNTLLDMAKHIAPERPWSPAHRTLDELENIGQSRLAQGLHDMETYRPFIFRVMLDPAYGGCFKTVHNKMLRISSKTEQDLEEAMRRVLEDH